MFDMFPEWFQIFFGSMIPWIESRYVIPYALWEFNWGLWQVFSLAILGNMLPIPFVLLFFKFVEKFLRKFRFWTKIMDWLFKRTRERVNGKIIKYEYLGLIMFVAVPLPFTGAWTGSLIAYLFDLKFSKSLLTILLGVIISATITVILYSTGLVLWSSING
ncbi:MAG: small multi-drug export protein [Thermoplasmatales archaeon]|nr:small multi-drug export protein [Thermoplasmatales archaeon]